LLSGRPAQAFGCFQSALLLFHRQPRIWLRLGESCVAQHVLAQKQRERDKQQPQLSPMVAAAGGMGGNRCLVLPLRSEGLSVFGGSDSAAYDDSPLAPDSGEWRTPSLTLGIKCLRNALQLCEAQLSSVAAADYATLQASASQGLLTPSEELALQLHLVLRLSLLQLAWCALLQDDYVQALHCAAQLLTDDCPANLKLYAHLYMADAMCHLNRTTEALEHLALALQIGEISNVASCGADTSFGDGDIDAVDNPYSPFGSSPRAGLQESSSKPTGAVAAARAILFANLATVHVLRDEMKPAMQYVQQALSMQPNSQQALVCLVYLELRSGNTESAVDIVKKQRVPSGFKHDD